MKNNSFKHFGPFGLPKSKPAKKLVLTAFLAAVLSGPYVFQISSKEFHFDEFASTAAPELTEYQRLEAEYQARRDLALEDLKKSDPKFKSLSELPAADCPDIKDPALAARIKDIEERKATLATKKADAEVARRIKEATDAKRKEIEDAAAAEKKAKDEAEAAEKKKKADAAEAKRLDCNDKDKSNAEKRECREDAKREEKEKKAEEASKKFDDRLEKAMDRCEKSSSRSKDGDEDNELACKSKAFAQALNTRDKNLLPADVLTKFKDSIGNDLFAMLYSNDERDAERASIILSNIFNGRMSGFPGIKRLIMDEVRRRAATPANKVAAEFKKALNLPAGTERTAQFTAAVAAKNELDTKLEIYGNAMVQPMQRIGDRDALAYYKSSYVNGIESIMRKLNSAVVGDVQATNGGANRGGSTRGGTSTEARVVTAADGKMVRASGVEYSLVSPGTISHITFGTPSSTRSTETTRGGVRVNN